MGLCKCPKRKTTGHFCFRHCVNVCEHCIVNNHTTCIVKSYTTWLKEASSSGGSVSSSSTAFCVVCQKQFESTEKCMKAVRLLCYHVVHYRCLSMLVKKHLKQNDIKENFKCPSCSRVLWVGQSDNNTQLESPVALQLYKIFEADWWGKSLISNDPIDAIELEKYLLQDSEQESAIIIQENTHYPNVQPSPEITQLNGTPHHYYYQEPPSTIESTNIIVNQAVHHRYNNVIPNQEQEQQQLQSPQFIGQILNKQLNKTYKSPLLSNNDDDDYPSGKYYRKPKKFENQLMNFGYGIWNSQHRVYILILAVIVIILFVVFACRSSDDSSFDNVVDYGGDGDSNINEAIPDKL